MKNKLSNMDGYIPHCRLNFKCNIAFHYTDLDNYFEVLKKVSQLDLTDRWDDKNITITKNEDITFEYFRCEDIPMFTQIERIHWYVFRNSREDNCITLINYYVTYVTYDTRYFKDIKSWDEGLYDREKFIDEKTK